MRPSKSGWARMRQLTDDVVVSVRNGRGGALLDTGRFRGADPAISDRIARRLTESMNSAALHAQDGKDDLYRRGWPDTCYHRAAIASGPAIGVVASRRVGLQPCRARGAS